MDAEVQAFIDKLAEKAAHKAVAIAALGEAKLAEHEGREADAARAWDVVLASGMNGEEGRCHDELQAMADAYVDAHPEQFTAFEQYLNPDGKEKLIMLIAALRKAGMVEEAMKLTMLERAKFERVKVHPAVEMRVRAGGKG